MSVLMDLQRSVRVVREWSSSANRARFGFSLGSWVGRRVYCGGPGADSVLKATQVQDESFARTILNSGVVGLMVSVCSWKKKLWQVQLAMLEMAVYTRLLAFCSSWTLRNSISSVSDAGLGPFWSVWRPSASCRAFRRLRRSASWSRSSPRRDFRGSPSLELWNFLKSAVTPPCDNVRAHPHLHPRLCSTPWNPSIADLFTYRYLVDFFLKHHHCLMY
jgi:hypothetical protein